MKDKGIKLKIFRDKECKKCQCSSGGKGRATHDTMTHGNRTDSLAELAAMAATQVGVGVGGI